MESNINTATSSIENYINSIASTGSTVINSNLGSTIPYTASSTSYATSWNYDYYINKTIEKLPTIIQIKSYQKEGNVLNIKYDTILDKFLPESGTLYIYNTNIYGVFNKDDDRYWYKKLSLTCDINDLNKAFNKKLKFKYAVLLNDYDIKLSNEEIQNLANPIQYKNFAHLTLENILNSEGFDSKSKNTKINIHSSLESKLINLYE